MAGRGTRVPGRGTCTPCRACVSLRRRGSASPRGPRPASGECPAPSTPHPAQAHLHLGKRPRGAAVGVVGVHSLDAVGACIRSSQRPAAPLVPSPRPGVRSHGVPAPCTAATRTSWWLTGVTLALSLRSGAGGVGAAFLGMGSPGLPCNGPHCWRFGASPYFALQNPGWPRGGNCYLPEQD